jgi:ATP-dependent DNA ligase
MQNLPTLFKRNKNGSIQHWTMFWEDDHFWTEYGQVGGKTTTSTPTYAKGNNFGKANEKTPQTVAMERAQKQWDDHVNKGYVENVDDVPDDTQTNFSPTLAQKYQPKHLEKHVFISPKLDGLRCIIDKNEAVSRNNKPYFTLGHLFDALGSFFEKFPTVRLDGEIYNHEYNTDFNKIISLTRKKKPTSADLAEAASKLQFHVFDMFDSDRPDMTTIERQEFLHMEVAGIDSMIKIVENIMYEPTIETIEEAHASYIEDGYEGIMLKNPSEPYIFTRTKHLQKYKAFDDDEFLVLDITPGNGRRAGMMGRLICQTKDGKEFGASGRGNDELFTELLVNKDKYIGKLATIRYQNLTPDGIPRFPVMVDIGREDL